MPDWFPTDILSPLKTLLLGIIDLLTQILETITSWLPNPDPFRDGDVVVQNTDDFLINFAAYWMDTIWDMQLLVSMGVAVFEMFAIAWLIMTLWHWLKMR